MYSVPVPTFASHFRSSSATNSGPIVRTNVFRDSPEQHHIRQRLDHLVTPQSSSHANRQTLPRVFIDHRQHADRSSIVGHRAHEVIAPDVIRPLRPQPHARAVIQPEPSSWPLFLRYFQPFATPDALHSIFPHLPARCPQQRRDPPVAVTAILTGQRNDRFASAHLRPLAGSAGSAAFHATDSPVGKHAARSCGASAACSTAQRRRSGLRSFPPRYPSKPASPATAPPPPASVCVLPFQFLQSFRLIQFQAAVFLPPAVVRLYGDLRFLAGLRGGLSVRDLHFNLPQQRYDLFRLVSLHRHVQLPFRVILSHSRWTN